MAHIRNFVDGAGVWGLPPDHPVVSEAYLAAFISSAHQYGSLLVHLPYQALTELRLSLWLASRVYVRMSAFCVRVLSSTSPFSG